MVTIYKKLSRKVQEGTNLSEVIIRIRNGNNLDLQTKSGIFVTPDNFRKGEIVVNRRKVGNDVDYHEAQREKMEALCSYILKSMLGVPVAAITPEWLRLTVDKFHHPEAYQPKQKEKKDVFQLIEEYLSKKQISYDYVKALRVLARDIARYQAFVRATDKDRKEFAFDVDEVSKDDIEDFICYLRNEYDLSKEYPKLFSKLLSAHPVDIGRGHHNLEQRGENTLINLKKKLKTFFRWLYDTGYTSNRPFDGIKIESAKYGTPYYITIQERNKIAEADIKGRFQELTEGEKKEMRGQCKCSIETLEQQRDIFIFQCFVGCRVGDLMKLTPGNIINGILTYTPHKTKDESESFQARVPLHPKALELISKYQGVDKNGRLFPFISSIKYNKAIKAIFTLAGITRTVEVRNSKTGESELRPINEIASSHLARRTFIGNAYFKVQDPAIIGKMSGHVDGSKAFKRYRKIEDDTLKEVINLIG